MYIMYFHHFSIIFPSYLHWCIGALVRRDSKTCLWNPWTSAEANRKAKALQPFSRRRRAPAVRWPVEKMVIIWWLYGDLILFSWWFSGDLIVMVIKSVMYHHVSCCLLGFLGLHFSVCKAKHVYARLLNKSQIDSLAAWSKSRFSFKDSGMLFLNSAAGS